MLTGCEVIVMLMNIIPLNDVSNVRRGKQKLIQSGLVSCIHKMSFFITSTVS